MEIIFGEPVNTGNSLYSGAGNFDMLESEQWKTGNIWSREFLLCFFLQQDRSTHNLIICLLIATSSEN